jgi:hypothetical protein
MSLEALADAMQVDPSDIVRTLFMKGIMLSLNQVRHHTVGLVRSSIHSCIQLSGDGHFGTLAALSTVDLLHPA